MELTYFGHSAFSIKSGKFLVLVDPFFNGNPHIKVDPFSFQPTAVVVTHGHSDHIGDAIDIAKKSNALIISNFEICNWFMKEGVSNVHPLHIGGGNKFEFGYVKLTIAHHGSTSNEGISLGSPCGVIISIDGKTIYHAGDTGLFMDMQLIGELTSIDVAMLPIGGNFTMDIRDALRATEFLKPKVAIPMHYNTFPLIKANPEEFVSKLPKAIKGVVMQPGITINI